MTFRDRLAFQIISVVETLYVRMFMAPSSEIGKRRITVTRNYFQKNGISRSFQFVAGCRTAS